jgi:hypothetical protein
MIGIEEAIEEYDLQSPPLSGKALENASDAYETSLRSGQDEH